MIGQEEMTMRLVTQWTIWSMGWLEARMDGVKRKRVEGEKGGIKQWKVNRGFNLILAHVPNPDAPAGRGSVLWAAANFP